MASLTCDGLEACAETTSKAVEADSSVSDESEETSDEWGISESQTAKDYEADKFGFWHACAVNTMNMFGTGPFITVPFLFAATVPAGPQALIGYALAAIVCICDSTIWGELSSMMPYSGGSYIYLRESFGKDKWGRFMAFLFIFQFLISAPIEIASGFIAMSQYLAYITGITYWVYNALIGCGFCMISILVLYQDLTVVGKLTIALWVGTIAAIVFALITGFVNFNPENLKTPPEFPPATPAAWGAFVYSLGSAARIGIYDFAGYYDACQMGDEVKNARKNVPRTCVWTCVLLGPIFVSVILAIAGVVPWFGETGFVSKVLANDYSANYVMSTFCEILFGRPFAIFFTLVVIYTIFGSCFSLLLGYAYIPYAAARDGYFYSWFNHEHPTKKGLADYSLLFLGALASVLCFVDLSLLIEGMLTTRLIIQFIAQAIGTAILRKKAPKALRVYHVPLYPLPIIINLLGFGFVFATTPNWIFSGNPPLLEVGVLSVLAGSILYFPFAKVNKFWPYALLQDPEATVDESAAEADNITPQSALEMSGLEGMVELHVGSLEVKSVTDEGSMRPLVKHSDRPNAA